MAPGWAPLFRAAGVAAAALVGVVVAGIVVFVAAPPPGVAPTAGNARAWLELFQRSRWLGVLELDGLMLVGYALMAIVFVALFVLLRRTSRSWSALGVLAVLASAILYYAANQAFSLMALGDQYARASELERLTLVTSAQTLLAIHGGTPFDASYVLCGLGTLIVSVVMLHSRHFTRAIAWLGIAIGALMLVPPTAGAVGVLCSIAVLLLELPWFALLARRLAWITRDSRAVL